MRKKAPLFEGLFVSMTSKHKYLLLLIDFSAGFAFASVGIGFP